MPPIKAPRAFPRLKEIREHEAPKSSPPLEFLIKSTCWGAETANKHAVQNIIKIIDIKGFFPKKKITIKEMQATSCVIPATSEGAYLSDNFPPKIFPIYMPAPASIIIKETYLGKIPDKLTKSGLM